MKQDAYVHAVAPSNIAFLKYWGKREAASQWPADDSVSMTLSSATTTTRAFFSETEDDVVSFKGAETDTRKALEHLQFLRKELGFGEPLRIETANNFPMACGIASSASGFAALTIAAMAAWTRSRSFDDLAARGFSRTRLAHLARQGSGSAGRSLWGGFVHWEAGHSPATQNLRQCFTTQHWQLADLIVVLSDQKKSVSSSDAHKSAWTSPLFAPRLAGLHERRDRMFKAIEQRDLAELGPLIEEEALEMHSVMMTSHPAANFLTEETAKFLVWLRNERKHGNFRAWFTIDAGPNVHVICEAENVEAYRKKVLASFPQYQLICDKVGSGPSLEGYFPQ
jgi:diphosphomevalonate decarboxylase